MAAAKLEEKYITVNNKIIKIGGPIPQPKEGEKLVRRTASLCPDCYRYLPAIIVEREGKTFIRRICPDHGEIEEVYWGDAEMLKKAFKYEGPGRGISPQVEFKGVCPFSCGICPLHKNMTALANIVLTNRCNLSCWYCFFYAEKAGFVYEPSVDEIREMIKVLRSERPVPGNAVQLTGGEPTLREDLVEIVKMIREMGVDHVQLNTHGITFVERPEYLAELRRAGVNTLYLSFDGVTPESNPKNHWEIPYIFKAARDAGMTSIVLVPTVIKGVNDHELGAIIEFAALNIDIVRGVNFQPVSLVGQMPRKERDKYRITIPDVIKKIEEQTNGQIPRDAWYTVPFSTAISDFVEALTGRPQYKFTNHPACGMATYVFPEFSYKNGEKVLKRFVPITEFVDVEGFHDYLQEKADEIRKGANKYITAMKVLLNIGKFIRKDKQPEGIDLMSTLRKIFLRRDYSALGEFHYKALFLGMMHFMDLYNYDVQRVIKCDIHYLVPGGKVIPFCTFNVMPDIYRDRIQREYETSLEEYAEEHPGKVGEISKYKRDIRKLVGGEEYIKTYKQFFHLFRNPPGAQ
jgi:uncharacterized radical SAM superfamily Fe-S cluster-containing enzyme